MGERSEGVKEREHAHMKESEEASGVAVYNERAIPHEKYGTGQKMPK